MTNFGPSFNLVASGIIAVLYAANYQSGLSIRSVFSSSLKCVIALPRYFMKFGIEYDDHNKFAGFSASRDPVWLPKVASTFLSQSVKFFAIKYTESLIMSAYLSDEFLQYSLYLPPMAGCSVMYAYRFLEAGLGRGEYHVSAKNLIIVAADGALIGYVGSYVKGTPLSKVPNMLYDLGGYFYDYDKFEIKLPDKLLDAAEAVIVSIGEMALKYYTRDLQVKVDKYANETQAYYFPVNSTDQRNLNHHDFKTIPSNRKVISTVQFTDAASDEVLERCRFLNGVVNLYTKQSKEKEKKVTFSVEEEFGDIYNFLPTFRSCYFPCVDSENCQSRFNVYINNKLIDALGMNEMNSACPQLMQLIGQEIHHRLIICENDIS